MCKADPSPLPRAKFKNEWNCTSRPAYDFVAFTGDRLKNLTMAPAFLYRLLFVFLCSEYKFISVWNGMGTYCISGCR
jgi:hypothetical protein